MLLLHTRRYAHIAAYPTVGSALGSASTEIFDVKLLESQPQLVISHLLARKVDTADESVSRIVELNKLRSDLISKRDHARGRRKSISSQFGSLLKINDGAAQAKLVELKGEVEKAAATADMCNEDIIAAEDEIRTLFSILPNLLDDRYRSVAFIMHTVL